MHALNATAPAFAVHRRVLGLLCVLLLAACAGSEPRPTAEERAERQASIEADIEKILTEPLENEDYSESESCLATFQYDRVEVLDQQRVLFVGRGGRVWLNELRRACPGLRRRHALQFDIRGSRICSLDSFRAIETRLGGIDEVSGVCVLGEFQQISEAQAEAIRAAIREERN